MFISSKREELELFFESKGQVIFGDEELNNIEYKTTNKDYSLKLEIYTYDKDAYLYIHHKDNSVLTVKVTSVNSVSGDENSLHITFDGNKSIFVQKKGQCFEVTEQL